MTKTRVTEKSQWCDLAGTGYQKGNTPHQSYSWYFSRHTKKSKLTAVALQKRGKRRQARPNPLRRRFFQLRITRFHPPRRRSLYFCPLPAVHFAFRDAEQYNFAMRHSSKVPFYFVSASQRCLSVRAQVGIIAMGLLSLIISNITNPT